MKEWQFKERNFCFFNNNTQKETLWVLCWPLLSLHIILHPKYGPIDNNSLYILADTRVNHTGVLAVSNYLGSSLAAGSLTFVLNSLYGFNYAKINICFHFITWHIFNYAKFITSLAKEVMFLVALICLFICLFVCLWTTLLKKLWTDWGEILGRDPG